MGADVNNFDSGGGVTEGIGALFQGLSTVGVTFGVKDAGPDPPDGAGPEQLSAQGRATAHREANKAAGIGELGISSAGGGNVGSGLQGDKCLRHKEAEYGCTIYCDAFDSGTL